MAGGVFLAIAGVWALCQVLGGDALGRLGITGIGSSPAAGDGGGTSPPPNGGSSSSTGGNQKTVGGGTRPRFPRHG